MHPGAADASTLLEERGSIRRFVRVKDVRERNLAVGLGFIQSKVEPRHQDAFAAIAAGASFF